MNKITSITRRDIGSLLINGWEVTSAFGDTERVYYNIWGCLNPVQFLNRLYHLQSLPSFDSRLSNAEDDIFRHTVFNPNDYEYGWFWKDKRFNLSNGSDENLLNFLSEIFHPEVRNDQYAWNELLMRINELLKADNYKLFVKNKISNRSVYGWKSTERTLHKITEKEIAFLGNLFNCGGYVLNFSNHRGFNDFTEDIIGIRITEEYPAPMAKSLNIFLKEEDEDKIIKMLLALWDCFKATEQFSNSSINSDYKKAEGIIKRISNTNNLIIEQISEIKGNFNNTYIHHQIDEMIKAQQEDPTNAIGLAKELVESTCKTILEYYNHSTDFDNLTKMVKATTKILKITPEDISDNIPEARSMKSILGSFATIVDGLSNLRNTYGRGHGKGNDYRGLNTRHAKLATGASSTLVHFLWDSFDLKNHIPSK